MIYRKLLTGTAVAAPLALMTFGTAWAQDTAPNTPQSSVPPSQVEELDVYGAKAISTAGPLVSRPIQDTPYSISVTPAQLIQNLNATQPDELFRINPVTQIQQPTAFNGRATVNIRGFNVATFEEDGLLSTNGWGIAVEQYDRMEVLSGLSGFLYGPANVGGLVNFVSKRPTATPFAEITVGDIGASSQVGGSGYGHADLGGPIDKDGRFAYRLNLVGQDGGQGADHTNQQRWLASGVLDWHATDNLTVEGFATYYGYRQDGLPPSFATAANVVSPRAPDADKLWSEPWSFQQINTYKAGANIDWKLSDIFTFRGAYRFSAFTDHNIEIANTIQANGTYTQTAQVRAPRWLGNNDGYAFLDAHFTTFGVENNLTVGFHGDSSAFHEHPDEQASATITGPFNFVTPTYGIQPNFVVGTKPQFVDQKTLNTEYSIGDVLNFNKYWSLVVGGNYVDIGLSTIGATGATTAHYDKGAVTPTASLLFKPLGWLTTYATYMESLEQGSIVPSTGAIIYTNAGQILQPLVDHQYEVGAKAVYGQTLLTAALFQIDKANQFGVNNGNGTQTFVQDGREVHRGLELTATGKLTEDLTIVGGLTVFEAKVTDQQNTPTLDGKRPVNVAEQMVKLYAEYHLPFVPGFYLTGGAYYTGDFYADAANLDKRPGVLLGDVGARYETIIQSRPVTFRLTVNNVADVSYWQSANFEGDPRRISFTASTRF